MSRFLDQINNQIQYMNNELKRREEEMERYKCELRVYNNIKTMYEAHLIEINKEALMEN